MFNNFTHINRYNLLKNFAEEKSDLSAHENSLRRFQRSFAETTAANPGYSSKPRQINPQKDILANMERKMKETVKRKETKSRSNGFTKEHIEVLISPNGRNSPPAYEQNNQMTNSQECEESDNNEDVREKICKLNMILVQKICDLRELVSNLINLYIKQVKIIIFNSKYRNGVKRF